MGKQPNHESRMARLFTAVQEGVLIEVTAPHYETNVSVAGIQIVTKNNNSYALLTVEELRMIHDALGEILEHHTTVVDPEPHLDDLNEIDATLRAERKD